MHSINWRRFNSVTRLPNTRIKQAWWFVFQNGQLLIIPDDDRAEVPRAANVSDLHVTAVRQQVLGTLDGVPCFSAEISDEADAPAGMSFQELRSLYGAIDDDLFWVAGRALQIVRWDATTQFCGRCGNRAQLKSDEHAKICPDCGLTTYPKFSPAIIVAITRGDEILLAKAARFKHNFRSVLAGFVEAGESLEACIRREVKEEVDLDIKNISYFGSQPWPFSNSLMIAFTAEYASGMISIDPSELIDADWYSAENLPNIPGKPSVAHELINWFIQTQQKRNAEFDQS